MIETTIFCSNCQTADNTNLSLKEFLLEFQQANQYHVISDTDVVLRKDKCKTCSNK